MGIQMSDLTNDVYLYVYSAKSEETDLLIEKSVKSYLGTNVTSEIKRTKKGKPYIFNIPNINVSVSHSGKYCICAVSQMNVGVDLQKHERLKNESVEEAAMRFMKLSDRFFHHTESDYVKAAPFERFFDVWCAKESYVKYTGSGIDDSFGTYSVIPGNYNGSNSWECISVCFEKIDFEDEYTLVVCAENRPNVRIIR